MTRGGRIKQTEQAERRCIATGDCKPVAHLVRFVVGPENTLVPDIAHKLPGRGLWVSANRAALDKAVSKKLFARAARSTVRVPDGLGQLTEAQLLRRVTDLLSLARKSGAAITGFEKVKHAVTSGKVAALLQARDGSVAQLAKIRPPAGENTHITCLFGNELGLAFGRENVIHAALAAGGLTERIVEEASRLAGFREISVQKRAKASDIASEQEGVEDV